MFRVSLSGIRFQAPIGLYPQELLLNNEIEIDLSVAQNADPESLPFIDYEQLYALIAQEMKVQESLLEGLLKRIVTAVSSVYPGTKISISIRKLHPPFGGQAGYAEVKWESPVR